MPTVRAGVRAFATCVLLLPAWAAGGAAEKPPAPPQPEDREIQPHRGQLKLEDAACKRLLLELKDIGKPVAQRVEIAGLFAYFREERAVRDLAAIVQAKNESMALKTAALWALGEIGHPLAMPAFQYALYQMYVKDPEWAQARGITMETEGRQSAISLREMCEARLGRLAEPVLLKQRADENPGLADVLLAPLVGGITPEKPPDEKDERTGRLRAALISVAAVGDRSPTAIKALIAVLTADDNYYPWDFKVIASEALSTILVRRAEELKGVTEKDGVSDEVAAAFIQAFAVTDEPAVRERGGGALRRIGWADRAAKSLVTVLQTPNLPKRVRCRAIEALACLRSTQAADQLIFLLFDPDEHIRWRAAVALGTCGDKRAPDFLRKVARDKDPFVRLKAVAALGHLMDAAVLPDLAVALDDPDHRVRRQAALGLGHLGLRQGIPALVKGLEDPSPSVRAMCIIGLGYITRAEGMKHVPAILTNPDPDPGVRRVAVQVLDKFINPGATRALIAALGDSDKAVRDDAAKAIPDRIARNAKEVVPLLVEAIAKSKGDARLGAIQCLAADYQKARATKDAKRSALYDRLLAAPDEALAAALIAALADAAPAVRAAAGNLLADHGWTHKKKDLLTPVVPLANDTDRAARAAGQKAQNYLNNLR